MRAKLIAAIGGIGLVSSLVVGCQPERIGEVTSSEIEPTIREYYDAFNNYETSRIEPLFTESAWHENGSEIGTWVFDAKNLGYKTDFVSADSIKVDGECVWVTIAVNSTSGEGQDVICLVRERGDWKIAQLLTRRVGQVMPSEPAASGSSCCPTGGSCN